MSVKITRRDFLKGTAAGAMGLAVTGLIGKNATACAEEAPAVMSPQEAIARLNPQDYDYRSKDTDFSHVFSPWKLGPFEIKHRMVKSAAGSDTGRNPEEWLHYYEDFAKGGVDMIWIEDFADLYNNFPSTRKPARDTVPFQELADRIHALDGHLGYQLSTMSFNSKDMTLDDVHMLQEDFINAAVYLQSQGLDAVEINAAGNNVGQTFFSRLRTPARTSTARSPLKTAPAS